MPTARVRGALPGVVATVLVVLTSTLWMFWGTAEMYYEAWGGPWGLRLAYLSPFAVTFLLALLAITWPRWGGWLLVVLGGAFSAWVLGLQLSRGARPSLLWVASWFPVTLMLVLTGGLFLAEARHRRRLRESGAAERRRWAYLLVAGAPLLVFLAVTVYWAPTLWTRVDDAGRGMRRIEGDGVSLVWAPAGPGWNWRQPWGGYPSWSSLARYGQEPRGPKELGRSGSEASAEDMTVSGLCRFLTADGTALAQEPQNVWRFPTTQEVVRSLGRHGRNAGCRWNGEPGRAECRRRPDKETPLWAPDEAPIYYWTADEAENGRAFYVSYQGYVGSQPKYFGNPRHGYRCVREP
jgi:hypothetical protein